MKIVNDEKKIFPAVKWGNKPKLGGHAIIIGSPIGLDFSVSFGIVSAIDRIIPKAAPPFVPFIQTDASMNRGNSGGPLFDADGYVVGINTLILTPPSREGVDLGSVGLGFAIDGDYAQHIIQRLKSGEKITRPLVGIIYRAATKKDYEDIENGVGSFIEEIIPKGPSENILKVGDIILALDGDDVKMKMLATEIAMRKPKTDVVFTIVRKDELMNIIVTLGEK